MNCLFWNLQGNDLSDHVARLVTKHQLDLIVVAEGNGLKDAKMLTAVNSDPGRNFRFHYAPGGKRIKLFSNLPSESVESHFESGGVSIRHVKPPLTADFILVAVHLPSKLRWAPNEQQDFCGRVREYVDKAENSIGHQRTIVVGDLNMNPFEHGIVSSEGLHAVMTRRDALRRTRVVQGRSRHLFYNPMWNEFGDRSNRVPGTCYFARSTPLSYYWNMFDQVLVRPDLLDAFPESGIAILTDDGETSFIDKDGRPDSEGVSDHLPIKYQLDLPILESDK